MNWCAPGSQVTSRHMIRYSNHVGTLQLIPDTHQNPSWQGSTQLLNEQSSLTDPKVSLPRLQEPASGHYHDRHESSPHFPAPSSDSLYYYTLASHLRLEVTSNLFLPRFPTRLRCPTHLIFLNFVVIEFSSLLFMCRVNSYKANYRHSTV
jgi:hypothetical protein